MLIFQNKQQKQSSFLRILSFIVLISFFILGGGFSYLYVQDAQDQLVPLPELQESASVEDLDLGSGALALDNSPLSFSLPHLEREIVLLSMNSRIDRSEDEELFLIGLRSSAEMRKFHPDEEVYLRFIRDEEKPRWVFSQEEMPIRVCFRNSEKEGVLVQLSLDAEGEGKFYAKERREFFIKHNLKNDQVLDNKAINAETLPFQIFKGAVCWGVDTLIGKYGGATYSRLRQKSKVEFYSSQGNYFCYLSPGDYLMWTNEKWHVLPKSSLSRKYPIAYVRSANGGNYHIEVWDVSGFHREEVTLSHSFTYPSHSALTEAFSSLRFRGGKQVTALVDNKRVFLREGDWWLKTEEGWKTLKRTEEFDAYLAHQKKGLLFVIEQIERKGKEGFVKGMLFDEMRSCSHPISLPVSLEFRSAHKSFASAKINMEQNSK